MCNVWKLLLYHIAPGQGNETRGMYGRCSLYHIASLQGNMTRTLLIAFGAVTYILL